MFALMHSLFKAPNIKKVHVGHEFYMDLFRGILSLCVATDDDFELTLTEVCQMVYAYDRCLQAPEHDDLLFNAPVSRLVPVFARWRNWAPSTNDYDQIMSLFSHHYDRLMDQDALGKGAPKSYRELGAWGILYFECHVPEGGLTSLLSSAVDAQSDQDYLELSTQARRALLAAHRTPYGTERRVLSGNAANLWHVLLDCTHRPLEYRSVQLAKAVSMFMR